MKVIRWISTGNGLPSTFSDEYKMLVKKLRGVLDGSGRSVDGLRYYFEQALRYEILFWQASYVMEEWPF